VTSDEVAVEQTRRTPEEHLEVFPVGWLVQSYEPDPRSRQRLVVLHRRPVAIRDVADGRAHQLLGFPFLCQPEVAPRQLEVLGMSEASVTQDVVEWLDVRRPARHTRWYIGTMVTVKRIQTGVRIEQSVLKVLKGVAEFLDVTLGELIEGMALHNFEGKAPFGAETLGAISRLREVYGLELTAQDSHLLHERTSKARGRE
jgi:hypothetical protein